MEGSNPLTSDPIWLLLMMLLPILILGFFFHRLEAQLMVMAQPSYPLEFIYPQVENAIYECENNHNTIDSNVNENTVLEFKPRKCSNILDSHLDDIKVPILKPKPTPKRPVLAVTYSNQLREGPVGLLDDGLDDLMIPVLEPERKPLIVTHVRKDSDVSDASEPHRPAITAVPWDGKIRWAMKGCSIFEDEKEELSAYSYRPNILSRLPVSDLWIFQYGLRYIPAAKETDVYRTVRIEKLPSNTTLGQILPHVPGEIYSASLFDTNPITGYSTAIVVFIRERDALNFVHTSRNGLALGLSVASVALIHTPTYPMTSEMYRLIFHKGYRRSLVISSLRGSLKEEIHRILKRSVYRNYVESVEEGQVAGEIYVRFHSIKMAATAYDLFKGHPNFGKCVVRFSRKPTE